MRLITHLADVRHEVGSPADPAMWDGSLATILSLPLEAYGRVLGVLTLGTPKFNGYDDDDIKVAVAIATHLALSDRTRHKQVQALLGRPRLTDGPTVLLGDMNAWRRCRATRALDENHAVSHKLEIPLSFPAARPVLALDRIYTSGVQLIDISAHDTRAAQRASDHLPVVARIRLPD